VKLQIPTAKFQKNPKQQAPEGGAEGFGISHPESWNLELGIYLEFGCWNLEFVLCLI
jgi:hypothetical protein